MSHATALLKPVLTEKSLRAAATRHQYTFGVSAAVNKNQIKELVEKLYQVKVVAVNTIGGRRQLQATGRKRLRRVATTMKKAVVELAQNQTISLFDFGESQAKT